MCLYPRWISVEESYPSPYHVDLPSRRLVKAPCGKCAECRSNRQDAIAVRVFETSKMYNHAAFVTLTYRNSALPLALTTNVVDLDTGEVRASKPVIIPRLLAYDYRKKILSQKASSRPRFTVERLLGNGSQELFRYITPSVNMADVQNWLKVCRTWYKRKYEKDADFKMICCSEMGPRTCRPHYHVLFLYKSLDFLSDIYEFEKRWINRFGFVYHEDVKYLNEDCSYGIAKVAGYIGKYVSKGKFECESVRFGLSKKCRLSCSIGIGDSDYADINRSYHMAFDLYGAYDPNKLTLLSSGRRLSIHELDTICDEINSRGFYSYPGDDYKVMLPKRYKDKIFTYKKILLIEKRPVALSGVYKTNYKGCSYVIYNSPFETSGELFTRSKTKTQVCRFKISVLSQLRLFEREMERDFRQLERYKNTVGQNSSSPFQDYYRNREIIAKDREKVLDNRFAELLSSSGF